MATTIFRNWLEKATGKRLRWTPVCIGYRGGRKEYAVTFEDGTEELYYIDFENREAERV